MALAALRATARASRPLSVRPLARPAAFRSATHRAAAARPLSTATYPVCAAEDSPRGSLKYAYKPTWRPEAQHHVPAAQPSRESRSSTIFTHDHFGARVLYLNRSSTLNALDTRLMRQVKRQLREWEDNDAVEAVVIKSNLDDFFCRGGDVKYLYNKAKDPSTRSQALAYFREEYELSHLIATYTKPLAIQMNGEMLSASVAMHGEHRLSQESSAFSLPDVTRGAVPGVGASYVLGRLRNGLGMYLGLTGDSLDGEELYWSGLSTIHTSDDVAEEYLLYALGRATSTARSNFDIDRDPVFQRNMKALKDSRGGMRYSYLLEEGNATREDMRNFTRLKGWYQNWRRGKYRIAEDWAQGRQQEEETGSVGELFHFNTPAEMNDYSEPLDPHHFFLRDRIDHALATVFDVDADMPQDIAARFKDIADCFAGDPDQGDTLLLMAQDPDAHAPSRDQHRAALKGKLLPTNYEDTLRPHLRGIVTDALIRNGLVPDKSQVATLQDIVKQLTEQTWPYADPNYEAVAQACLAAGLDEDVNVVDSVCDAVRLVTAQVTGVPVSVLQPEQEASKHDDFDLLLASTADENSAESSDFYNIQDGLHRAHVAFVPHDEPLPDDLMSLDDISDEDRAALQAMAKEAESRRDAGKPVSDIAPLTTEELDAMYTNFGLQPPPSDQDAADDLPTDEATQILSRAFDDASSMPNEYVQDVTSDPAKLANALGMPDTPLTRKATDYVVRSLAKEKKSKYAVPQVRSVDEIYSRLSAHNSDFAKEVSAMMQAASPTAVRATHRLIVEGSTKSLAECLRMEYRVAARMLDTWDYVEGVEAALEGRSPKWSTETLDLDALFAATDDAAVGALPDFTQRLRLFDARREAEAQWEAELERWYESGEVQGAGSRELRSRFLWL